MDFEPTQQSLTTISNYLRHLQANPDEIKSESGAIRYLRSELEILLAETRRLAFLAGRPGTHPDITALRRWLQANPLSAITEAHIINATVTDALRRDRPFGPANLRHALESLGYQRFVNSTGTWYQPPTET
jgi:hypothetical protein